MKKMNDEYIRENAEDLFQIYLTAFSNNLTESQDYHECDLEPKYVLLARLLGERAAKLNFAIFSKSQLVEKMISTYE